MNLGALSTDMTSIVANAVAETMEQVQETAQE
jgi:hypothetical protein